MPWVPFPIDYAYGDQPLHAGVCVDVLRGNLDHVAEQNGNDIVIGPTVDRPVKDSWTISLVAAGTWYKLDRLPPLMINRRANSLEPRSVLISVRAWLSSAATVTLRAYLRASRDDSAYSSAFPGETSYAVLTVDSTTTKDIAGTIDYPETGDPLPPMIHPDDDIGGDGPPFLRAQLVLIASSDTSSRDVYVESIRLREVY